MTGASVYHLSYTNGFIVNIVCENGMFASILCLCFAMVHMLYFSYDFGHCVIMPICMNFGCS